MSEQRRKDRPGPRSGEASARDLARRDDISDLCAEAACLRDSGFGHSITFSRKVFIPLTKLCRDVCHYCTFATTPRSVPRAFMSLDEVIAVARQGAEAGCDEALFTLGEKPEARYAQARRELDDMGFGSTLEYVHAAAAAVLKETGLLPHINAGTMTESEIRSLKQVSASQGLMLETISQRLSERGGPHFGSPDKVPEVRLATLEAAGRAGVPFTTGLLVGIGETRMERIEALLAIRAANDRYGHIQEVIIQNFRAKPGTRMENAPEPSLDEHLWTIAAARLILGASMSIQAPPNLHLRNMTALIDAGINDWGGVSPVTPDFVNPECRWPALDTLGEETAAAGKDLAPRLTVYPGYIADAGRDWIAPEVRSKVIARADGAGLAHETGWRVGLEVDSASPVSAPAPIRPIGTVVRRTTDALYAGRVPADGDIAALFSARGADAEHIRDAADDLRRRNVGDTVTYVVNRNINYTNVCSYRCTFCAFSKGSAQKDLRGKPYDVSLDEVARRVTEAVRHGATEVCLQGGIHPDYSGWTYRNIVSTVRRASPGMHIHAFSALEVDQGASTLGMPIENYLSWLKETGLGTLPGTAAEILDDQVRQVICPDKLNTARWLDIHEKAHGVGLRSTATMMFGHMEEHIHWARHMLRVRALQERTGGFTEFVPLPFVHMEAPVYRRGRSRQGPSLREALLVHAVSRLIFDPVLPNIQASWVKLGRGAVTEALRWGVNDLGGTLMNESISRAAGNTHGQMMTSGTMAEIARSAGRGIRQRTTLYGDVAPESGDGPPIHAPLSEPQNDPAGKFARTGSLAALRRSRTPAIEGSNAR